LGGKGERKEEALENIPPLKRRKKREKSNVHLTEEGKRF